MHRINQSVARLVLIVAALGCSRSEPGEKSPEPSVPEKQPSGKIVLSGSSTMAPMMRAIGSRFQSLNPGVQIEVNTGESVKGISATREGSADIGMSSRFLTRQELQGLHNTVVAYDGICFIVHRDNPVTTLSTEQVAGIFRGAIGNWKEVGGKDRTIVVINRDRNASEVQLLAWHFQVAYDEIKAEKTASDNEEGIKAVAGNPDAIFCVSAGEANRRARAGTSIKPLAIDGVTAAVENVRTGRYSFMRPLVLITKEECSGLIKRLVAFAVSGVANDIIRDHQFVPASTSEKD